MFLWYRIGNKFTLKNINDSNFEYFVLTYQSTDRYIYKC